MVMTGKGGRQPAVPVHDEVRTALYQWDMPTDGPLFLKTNGDQITAGLISKYGNTALSDLGVNATMHQLRHRFGTVVNRNAGVRATQDLIGHSSISSTAVYTQVEDDALTNAVATI